MANWLFLSRFRFFLESLATLSNLLHGRFQVTGSSQIAFHVLMPTAPSTRRPFSAWNWRTIFFVAGPKRPSTEMDHPRFLSCSWNLRMPARAPALCQVCVFLFYDCALIP